MSTKIEWTDATWNPVTGCTKVSQGCKHCYAERVFPRPYPGRAFTDVRCHPERLDAPLHWRKSRRIFVNSMSDLFHEDVPFEFIDEIFAIMAADNGHTFQVLTKRPERMLRYLGAHDEVRHISIAQRMVHESTWPRHLKIQIAWPLPNVWLGISVEDQATADERIPLLLQTPAAVRFVSYEPALGPVDWMPWLGFRGRIFGVLPRPGESGTYIQGLQWMIAGGESGPHARPSHPDWFRSVRDQCAAAGVPFFFKQWGEWASVWHAQIDPKLAEGKPYIHVEPMCRLNRTNDSAPNYQLSRVGKKAAGRLLDGREHSEYPA